MSSSHKQTEHDHKDEGNSYLVEDGNSTSKQVVNIMFFIVLTLISGLVLYLIVCDTHSNSSGKYQPSRPNQHKLNHDTPAKSNFPIRPTGVRTNSDA